MVHDVGGSSVREPIVRAEHAVLPWELRVDALMWTLTDAARPGGPHMTVDELRRGIEALPPDDYRELGYYAKWLLSMIAVLAERGIVDAAQIERRADEIVRERGHVHP
jgi:hypothetical protein